MVPQFLMTDSLFFNRDHVEYIRFDRDPDDRPFAEIHFASGKHAVLLDEEALGLQQGLNAIGEEHQTEVA